MEFCILGPVEVWHSGARVPVGGTKPRSLLSSMLLKLDRVVSVDQLIDDVWGDDPPESRSTVQRLVSRLRKVIEQDDGHNGERVLITHPGGYRLSTDPETVDLYRFENLTKRGRAAADDGDYERAVELFRKGLALWRGPALADVTGPVRAVAGPRLEELRLSVLEDCIAVEVALGRHTQMVAELWELVLAHPLRERLAGHLMLALERCGRRAEALEVYQMTRKNLVTELGVEPGVTLRRMQHFVLAGGPVPDGFSPPSARPVRVTAVSAVDSAPANNVPKPAQLPADVGDFTGRVSQSRALAELALGGHRRDTAAMTIVAVTGASGVGKSTLAVHAAHRLRSRFPDGQLYADLREASVQSVGPSEILACFLRTLGVTDRRIPAVAAERAAMYRSLVADLRMLVLLDNVHGAAQVQPLLPGGPGCTVLVTSRNRLVDLDGAHLLNLDVLEPDEAIALLGTIAGPERIAAEPEAAGDIVKACGRLPLAIRITGSRLASRPGWSVRTMADRLADQRYRVDELQFGDHALRASFERSYKDLPPDLEYAFRRLSLGDSSTFGLSCAAVLLGKSPKTAELILERLVDANLIVTPAPGSYEFPDLLKLFARERHARNGSRFAPVRLGHRRAE